MEIKIKYLFKDQERIKEIQKRIKRFKYIFLFVDYDGTLVEIKPSPDQARLDRQTLSVLERICNNPKIIPTIVTGRTLKSLLSLSEISFTDKINLIGVHGGEVKLANNDKPLILTDKEIVSIIRKIKEEVILLLINYPNFLIEDKELSFSIHYRNCTEKDAGMIPVILKFLDDKKRRNKITYLIMKKVIEVLPLNINKGIAIRLIKSNYKYAENAINICIGDDITDEFLFKKNKTGINIKVADNKNNYTSEAKYYLKNVNEVVRFLNCCILNNAE